MRLSPNSVLMGGVLLGTSPKRFLSGKVPLEMTTGHKRVMFGLSFP